MNGLTAGDVTKGIAEAKRAGERIELRDSGKTPGLICNITAKGTATWMLRYTPKGGTKRKMVKLGRHSPQYGLAKARDDAASIWRDIEDGIDPALEREATAAKQQEEQDERLKAEKQKIEADARCLTVEKLAELYFAARANESGMKQNRRIIEFSVLSILASVPVETLRKSDIQRVVDDVRARGNSTQCFRVYEALRAMLRWALDRDYLKLEQQGIWHRLNLPEKGQPRIRVLSAREIQWLWQHCETTWADEATGTAVKLNLLLGQRITETCEAVKSEVSPDLYMWTIPGTRTKNKKPHSVPLPELARNIMREIMDKAMDERLFVGKRGATMRSDTVWHTIQAARKAWNEAHPDDIIEHFTVHDIRRTVATRLEEIGTSSTVLETLLNHISGKAGSVTRRHYAHGDLSLAIRAALTKWETYLLQCVEGYDPFQTSGEDIEAVEARARAEANGGRPKLRIVS